MVVVVCRDGGAAVAAVFGLLLGRVLPFDREGPENASVASM